MFVLPLIYFLEGQYWQIFVVQVVCCCFFMDSNMPWKHGKKKFTRKKNKNDSLFWQHSGTHDIAITNFSDILTISNAVASWEETAGQLSEKKKKKNTTKGNMTTTCVCLSNIHKFIYVTALKRTILQKKKKGWLHNLSTAQCDMAWRKIIFTNLTQNRFGYNFHKIFNYYTKWFSHSILIMVQQKALAASHKLTIISFQLHVIWSGCVICSNLFYSGYLQSRMLCQSGFIAIDVRHKKM